MRCSARGVAIGLVWCAWVVVGHSRALVFQSNVTLWRDALAKAPHRARPAIDLGRALIDQDLRDPEALALFHRGAHLAHVADKSFSADQQADWEALALANEARYWRLHGAFDTAEALLVRAVTVAPQVPFARAELFWLKLARAGCTPQGVGSWSCRVPIS